MRTLHYFLPSLRSWRYCVGARLKFWRRSRVPKKGSRDEAVEFLAASPLVTAPPSNLTRLYYNGSAAKSHSTTTQYRQLRRLFFAVTQALVPAQVWTALKKAESILFCFLSNSLFDRFSLFCSSITFAYLSQGLP